MRAEVRGAPAPFHVLFVCTGNICRSPMAEVAFRELSERHSLPLTTSSAGTANWHVGSDMDERARAALDRAGFTTPGSPARHATAAMVASSDLVCVMDHPHLPDVRALSPEHPQVALLGTWRVACDSTAVNDPFYGDDQTFDECLAQIVDACGGLLDDLAGRLA